jgi:Protein of unknown function (DUF3052)
MPAGYSGTPQARKLGLKPGHRLALDEPPDGWELHEPPGLQDAGPEGAADVIIAFFRAAAEIPDRLPGLARRIFPGGAIWAAWPRRAAGHASDITDTIVREHALALGLVDVKVAALDEDWSALRLVWRVENRDLALVSTGKFLQREAFLVFGTISWRLLSDPAARHSWGAVRGCLMQGTARTRRRT